MKTNIIPYTQDRLWEIFHCWDGMLFWKEPGRRRTKGILVGCKNKHSGKLSVRLGKVNYYVHRIVFYMHHGWQPEFIDHKDCITTNNHIENLRPATKSTNGMNRGACSRNTSGFKGVSWSRVGKKWIAQIKAGSECHHLGYFAKKEDAAEAYRIAADKFHGEFARTKKQDLFDGDGALSHVESGSIPSPQ